MPKTSSTRDAPIRSALRPLLRAVTRRAGALYQPVYIGPVAAADIIAADVQGIADVEGIPAYFGHVDEIVFSSGSPAVIVLGLTEAETALAASAPFRTGQQVVIWGDTRPEELAGRVRDWVEKGIALDVTDLDRPTGIEWSMGPTLARCARDPGRAYNPVLLLAPRPQLPLIAAEAALRLEAGGLQPVVSTGGPVTNDDPVLAGVGVGGAVVIQAERPEPDGAGEYVAIEALVRRGVQVVIVAEEAFSATVREDAAWRAILASAMTLVVSAERPTRTPQTAADPAARDVVWPPAGWVLVGAPAIAPEPDRQMTGSLETFPLPDILQTLGAGRHTGRLVVFARGGVGAIDFEAGRVVHASHEADRWTLAALADARSSERETPDTLARALVEQRVTDISTWDHARFTFLVGGTIAPEAEQVSLAVDALAMEVSRRLDEAPRRALRVGGLQRIWRRTAAPVLSVPPAARGLLAAVDGERSLDELARTLGLLDDEVLDAASVLVDQHLIEVVDAGEPRTALPTHAVATTLLGWGLAAEAIAVLDEARRLDALSAEGRFMLAHLEVAEDPQAAAADFRSAAQMFGQGGPPGLLLDATLNALLLEVRGQQRPPRQAWSETASLMRTDAGARANTPRHYAILAELASRAGERRIARTTVDALKAARHEEAAQLHSILRVTTEN